MMRRSTLVLGAAVIGMLLVSADPSGAAELGVRHRAAHPAVYTVYCGPCGCLGVTYVYHRALLSTYGLGFDPRNYDTTEPHYYFGRVRAYPRYFVEGGACPG